MRTNREILNVGVAAVVLTALACVAAHAGDLYWDTVSGAGVGGTGGWEDGQGNWNTDSGGGDGTNTTWDNLNDDSAIFNTPAGTVTVTGFIDVENLDFNADG